MDLELHPRRVLVPLPPLGPEADGGSRGGEAGHESETHPGPGHEVAPAHAHLAGLLQPEGPSQREAFIMDLLHLEEEGGVPRGHSACANQGRQKLQRRGGDELVGGLGPAAGEPDDPGEDHEEEIDHEEAGGGPLEVQLDPGPVADVLRPELASDQLCELVVPRVAPVLDPIEEEAGTADLWPLLVREANSKRGVNIIPNANKAAK